MAATKKVRALTKMAAPTPARAIKMPLTAGATMLMALFPMCIMELARTRSSLPTTTGTDASKAGPSKVVTMLMSTAIKRTKGSENQPYQ